jgi:hypothetical protein
MVFQDKGGNYKGFIIYQYEGTNLNILFMWGMKGFAFSILYFFVKHKLSSKTLVLANNSIDSHLSTNPKNKANVITNIQNHKNIEKKTIQSAKMFSTSEVVDDDGDSVKFLFTTSGVVDDSVEYPKQAQATDFYPSTDTEIGKGAIPLSKVTNENFFQYRLKIRQELVKSTFKSTQDPNKKYILPISSCNLGDLQILSDTAKNQLVSNPFTKNEGNWGVKNTLTPDQLKKYETTEYLSGDLPKQVMDQVIYSHRSTHLLIIETQAYVDLINPTRTCFDRLEQIQFYMNGRKADDITDIVLCIHINMNHFIAAKINISTNKLFIYDSLLYNQPIYTDQKQNCELIFSLFLTYKNIMARNNGNLTDNDINLDMVVKDVVQQQDALQCAVFATIFALYLISGQEPQDDICFTTLEKKQKLCWGDREKFFSGHELSVEDKLRYTEFCKEARLLFLEFHNNKDFTIKQLLEAFGIVISNSPALGGGSKSGNNKVVVQLGQSFRPGKKFMAQIGSTTVHFGQKGAYDFTRRGADAHNITRKKSYIRRHAAHEDWTKNGLRSAGFWARWILWNKPSKRASIRDLEAKYNLHIVPFFR